MGLRYTDRVYEVGCGYPYGEIAEERSSARGVGGMVVLGRLGDAIVQFPRMYTGAAITTLSVEYSVFFSSKLYQKPQ